MRGKKKIQGTATVYRNPNATPESIKACLDEMFTHFFEGQTKKKLREKREKQKTAV